MEIPGLDSGPGLAIMYQIARQWTGSDVYQNGVQTHVETGVQSIYGQYPSTVAGSSPVNTILCTLHTKCRVFTDTVYGIVLTGPHRMYVQDGLAARG